MRKLNRDAVEVPVCLAELSPGVHSWDDVKNKAEIRAGLELMQGRRCAYCEGSLDALGQHIDHFRRRHHSPELTFNWNNLYWSCYQPDSCGRYKDHDAWPYNVDDLIDPCVEDPDSFFRFRSDGTISVRPGLSTLAKHKAEETLRVFNLNPTWGRLRTMRKAVLSSYLYMVDDASGFALTELQDIFKDELAATEHLPFSTAIRHVLTELEP
jgi:uncharacterized protein (TIGR02646 family)